MALTAILCLLSAARETQDIEIEVGADFFYPKTVGTTKFDERPRQSDRLDLEDDLGHQHHDLDVGGHVRMSAGPHRALLGYERWRMSWNHALAEPLVFDGDTFPPNEPVRHELSADRWKARYDYRILRGEAAELRVGVRADYWLFEQEMETPSMVEIDDHLGTLVVEPSVSVLAGPLAGFRLEAEIAGIYYRILRHSVRTFEAQALLHWAPLPFLELTAGYRVSVLRFINIDSEQLNEVDLISFGPIASVELRF